MSNIEPNRIGWLWKGKQAGGAWDVNAISPTLKTPSGGYSEPIVIENQVGFFEGMDKQFETKNILIDEGVGMEQFTTNDFFCGAGGMGLGFKQAGFEIKGAWDFDKHAVKTYKHNVGEHVQEMSIVDMSFEDVPKSDVWTFGFPCQDLSNAGVQKGMRFGCVDCNQEFERLPTDIEWFDSCPNCGGKLKPSTRSGMFFEVMRLLDEMKELNPSDAPRILVAENVTGLKKYLPVLKEEFNKRGYRMSFALANSKYWFVPQNRKRYFVVGIREDIRKAFTFPKQQTDFVPKLSSVLEKNVDEKYYLNPEKTASIIKQAEQKVELVETHSCITPDRVEKSQNGRRAKENEEEMYTLTAQDKQGVILNVKEATIKGYAEATVGDSINISHPNSKTRRGRVGKEIAQTLLVAQEQVVIEVEQRLNDVAQNVLEIARASRPNEEINVKILENGNIRPHRMDEKKSGLSELNVASEENEAFTCTASHANKIYGESTGYRVRKLTPREYARLQGFPDDFEIVVSDSQFYKQMGNAVTVTVAKAIAEQIKKFLS